MSLTQWLTRSAPQVSCRPAIAATFNFVPTPSVEATRTGSAYFEKSGLNRPPKPPTSPSTPFVKVDRIASFEAAIAFIFASMSTPAEAYREGFKEARLYFGASRLRTELKIAAASRAAADSVCRYSAARGRRTRVGHRYTKRDVAPARGQRSGFGSALHRSAGPPPPEYSEDPRNISLYESQKSRPRAAFEDRFGNACPKPKIPVVGLVVGHQKALQIWRRELKRRSRSVAGQPLRMISPGTSLERYPQSCSRRNAEVKKKNDTLGRSMPLPELS